MPWTAAARSFARGATLSPDGEVIARAPLDHIAARFGPLLSVHRGELLEALRGRVEAPIERVDTRVGEGSRL